LKIVVKPLGAFGSKHSD